MQQILTDLHLPRTPSLAEMKTRIIFELRHNEELRGKEDTIVWQAAEEIVQPRPQVEELFDVDDPF